MLIPGLNSLSQPCSAICGIESSHKDEVQRFRNLKRNQGLPTRAKCDSSLQHSRILPLGTILLEEKSSRLGRIWSTYVTWSNEQTTRVDVSSFAEEMNTHLKIANVRLGLYSNRPFSNRPFKFVSSNTQFYPYKSLHLEDDTNRLINRSALLERRQPKRISSILDPED